MVLQIVGLMLRVVVICFVLQVHIVQRRFERSLVVVGIDSFISTYTSIDLFIYEIFLKFVTLRMQCDDNSNTKIVFLLYTYLMIWSNIFMCYSDITADKVLLHKNVSFYKTEKIIFIIKYIWSLYDYLSFLGDCFSMLQACNL